MSAITGLNVYFFGRQNSPLSGGGHKQMKMLTGMPLFMYWYIWRLQVAMLTPLSVVGAQLGVIGPLNYSPITPLASRATKHTCRNWVFLIRWEYSNAWKSFSSALVSTKQNLDCRYIFHIDLTPNGIELRYSWHPAKFHSVFQNKSTESHKWCIKFSVCSQQSDWELI